MEVGIIFVLFWDKISQPLDGIIWLFVIFISFLNCSLLNDRSEKFPRFGVALPDGSKFWYKVLYDGAKPWMKESEFCRGEKDVSRVLSRVSE